MTTLDELLRLHGGLTTDPCRALGGARPAAPLGRRQGLDLRDRSTWRAPRLLAELADDLGLDDDMVETVIDLIDQVHTLRGQLELLGQAIAEQPPATREAIAAALQRLGRR